ncbi:MAG: hypothetical protein RL363_31, partial [Bacteroidota bacterium]
GIFTIKLVIQIYRKEMIQKGLPHAGALL